MTSTSAHAYSPPPRPYTQKLLEQILSFNVTHGLVRSGCYKLSSINASNRQEFINVVLHFDVLSAIRKESQGEQWIYCIEQTLQPPLSENLDSAQQLQDQEEPKYAEDRDSFIKVLSTVWSKVAYFES
ncbi:hypothetical protein T265_05028 [Opisthorchis viverrini]|uniref:Uncharacterized protein n=1 Tax=Opisthorchis viverrini TaxID=6198 RepID=A0A075AFS3_OPIVI|nr:hypothetical protein T265_05028 [Opisthorchis viverrini]KER28044.1 hypothetical protein T265_05028 [Opisthorchis viverrini]